MKCIKDRCYSPIACGDLGSCRDLSQIVEAVTAMANASQSEATSRLRHMAQRALSNFPHVRQSEADQ
jgi:hypothetical protein